MTNIYFDSETLKKVDALSKKLAISRSAAVRICINLGLKDIRIEF